MARKAAAADGRSARELIQTLRGRGVSNVEIARELQRDPKMVRKVLNGETPGNNYAQTLRELVDRGQAETRPPRRRNKAGDVVKVRAPRGAKAPSITPTDTAGRYTAQKQGGRKTHSVTPAAEAVGATYQYVKTSYGIEGVRVHQVSIPKGKNTKGRAEATTELTNAIRSAARGQRKDTQRRVTIRLTFSNGRQMEVNDYNASTLLNRINEHGGGDSLGWLSSQMGDRYSNLDTSKSTITGVTLNVYNAPRTERARREYSPRGGK